MIQGTLFEDPSIQYIILGDKRKLFDKIKEYLKYRKNAYFYYPIIRITTRYRKQYYEFKSDLPYVKILLKANGAFKVGDSTFFVIDKFMITDNEAFLFASQSKPDPKTFFRDLYYLYPNFDDNADIFGEFDYDEYDCKVIYRKVNNIVVLAHNDHLDQDKKQMLITIANNLHESVKWTRRRKNER